ncbi:MAG: hypothetical protein KKF67_03010 [Nanoarchaeota archaeon]|nr:hypothetical protein [Nanoarchaeota archaeon]
MVKIKLKKTGITLLLVVIFQVFLLVNMPLANNYILSKVFLIKQIGDVSAETFSCCTKTNSGAICQDVGSSYLNCSEELIPTKCENSADCKIGCCIDGDEGLCTTQAPKKKCEDENGIWKSDSNCNLIECQKGCCVSGGDVIFITEQRCEKLFGTEKDFRDLETEFECLALAENQNEGACVFENGVCKFTTESECGKFGGKFSSENLCSKPSLNTTCEKQKSVGCLDGKDGIYWFDSCGNKENIYSSDKEASWNNGVVLKKEESCNSNSDNINSKDCGNCDSFSGSRCSETSLGKTSIKDGNYVCENLNCVDENKKERKNGESWCVYDSYIGEGKDTVGSRHWKKICIEGEVKTEPCADYRGQICVQADINSEKGKFSNAACVINEAVGCLNYNGADIGDCLKNQDCMIKNINVDSGFKFDVCVGRYPKGFDLTEENDDLAKEICSLGSQTCTVLYEKDWKGRWKCKKNCACETGTFTQQMNDLCVSLGDCGTYINYIGEGTNNIKVSGAPGVSWENYQQYSKADKDNYAKPNDLRYILGKIGETKSFDDINQTEQSSFSNAVKFVGHIAGGAGTLISAATFVTGQSLFYAPATEFSQSAVFLGKVPLGATGSATNVLGAFSGAATGAAIGAMAAVYLAKWRGIQGKAATIMTVSGAVAGAGLGYAYVTAGWSALGGAGATSPVLLGLTALGWTVVIAVIIMAYIAIIGWGKTEVKEIKFECLPWQPPSGGSNCEKCDDDPLKPCSEYKCSSLGKACKLVNEDTESPTCISTPNDNTAPKISTNEIFSNFTFVQEKDKRVKIEEDGKECITEFTPVVFSLKTEEYSQCRYSFQKTNGYEEMIGYPIEENKFSINHTFTFSVPSLESLSVYDVRGDLKEKFGKMDMYIRCQDYYGNYNLDEYMISFCINQGPDITPARIMATNPNNNAYLKYDLTELPLDIYLNEPAECKYDNYDKIYDSMTNVMECNTDLLQYTDFGWKCSTKLTGLKNTEENTFYFRCKDQPWFNNDTIVTFNNETNETIIKTRNINLESFVYTLKNSEDNLKIISISPSGKIEAGFEPLTVNFEVETSGGAKDGEATCYYKFSEGSSKVLFFDTFADYHEQTFNSIMGGKYNIEIECKDEAGNTANTEIEFEVNVDNLAPLVVRVYSENSQIKLVTDEKAECYYDFYRCNFDVSNAAPMTVGFSTQHSAKRIAGKTYYVKCIDVWGNQGDGCAIKVQAI